MRWLRSRILSKDSLIRQELTVFLQTASADGVLNSCKETDFVTTWFSGLSSVSSWFPGLSPFVSLLLDSVSSWFPGLSPFYWILFRQFCLPLSPFYWILFRHDFQVCLPCLPSTGSCFVIRFVSLCLPSTGACFVTISRFVWTGFWGRKLWKPLLLKFHGFSGLLVEACKILRFYRDVFAITGTASCRRN